MKKLAKYLNRHLTTEKWKINVWQDAPLRSLRKCELKHWDTTIHLLEWPKSRTLITPNAGEDMKQQELSFIPDRRYSTLEYNWAVSYKIKHILIIQFSDHTLWYFPKGVKSYVHVKTCTQVSIEASYIFFNIWKQPRCLSTGNEQINWYVQTIECYSVLKLNELLSHKDMEEI